MHVLFSLDALEIILGAVIVWVDTYIYNISALVQSAVILICFLLAVFTSRPLRRYLKEHQLVQPRREKLKEAISPLIVAFTWIIIQAIVLGVCLEFNWEHYLLQTVLMLLLAWVFARFTTSFVHDVFLSRLLAVTIWTIAALHIVGLLRPTEAALDQIGVRFGELRLSLLDLIWGFGVLMALLWIANSMSSHLENRINQRTDLEPTLKVLFNKLLRVFLIGFAILLGVSALGIDISAFTVLGGAIGLGLGFGLQKVISNLVCGVILLMDRSIKPGDVIAVQGGKMYGTVKHMSARFVAIRTPGGQEHLIPNEQIITNTVENWSYSDRDICISIPIRISLDSDVRQAMKLMIAAAKNTRRVLLDPKPFVMVQSIGECAFELELLVWINDPENGMGGLKSDIYLATWDAFTKEGIRIPVPQHEVNLFKRTNGNMSLTPTEVELISN